MSPRLIDTISIRKSTWVDRVGTHQAFDGKGYIFPSHFHFLRCLLLSPVTWVMKHRGRWCCEEGDQVVVAFSPNHRLSAQDENRPDLGTS